MRYAISIDFGGTKVSGSVVNEKGKILLNKRHPTEANKGKMQVIRNVNKVVADVRKDFKKKISGIGVCMPGFVDDDGKMVFGGGTLHILEGLNLRKEIQKKAKLPVFIDNDANCFALAEAVFGAGKKHNVVIGIIWGTGVGGGIVVGKKVFRGSFGGAGEFGHMVIDPTVKKGPKCGCGQHACLEMLTSGKNIQRLYKKLGGKINNANPRDIYDSKEAVAKKVIKNAVHNLGLGIATLTNVTNPDIIVLGGGVSQLPAPVYSQINKQVKKYALPSLTKRLKVVRHKISDDAGILGAAALVFEG